MLTNLELFENFRYLDWLIYKYNQLKETENNNQFDVSRGQGRILAILLIEDSVSTRDLAKKTGFNISSLNEILSKLEKKELVKRIPFPKDKRIIVNCLTEKGKQYHPELDLNCFNCLNKEEKKQFLELIEKVSLDVENKINMLEDEELCRCYINRKNSFKQFLEKVESQEQLKGKVC